jgi:hypothetical protein
MNKKSLTLSLLVGGVLLLSGATHAATRRATPPTPHGPALAAPTPSPSAGSNIQLNLGNQTLSYTISFSISAHYSGGGQQFQPLQPTSPLSPVAPWDSIKTSVSIPAGKSIDMFVIQGGTQIGNAYYNSAALINPPKDGLSLIAVSCIDNPKDPNGYFTCSALQ